MRENVETSHTDSSDNQESWTVSLLTLNPQYLHTNSQDWSPYISFKNYLREFNKRSKIDLFVVNLLILIDFALNNLWISLGENWCWSLLGLKGLSILGKMTGLEIFKQSSEVEVIDIDHKLYMMTKKIVSCEQITRKYNWNSKSPESDHQSYTPVFTLK